MTRRHCPTDCPVRHQGRVEYALRRLGRRVCAALGRRGPVHRMPIWLVQRADLPAGSDHGVVLTAWTEASAARCGAEHYQLRGGPGVEVTVRQIGVWTASRHPHARTVLAAERGAPTATEFWAAEYA